MARFMLAHLQHGRYSDADISEARILKETTVQQMHSILYTPDPRILGTAHSFFDFSDNGQRTIGHSGDAPPMNSLLLLLPDQNLGVFVIYNSEGGGDLTNQHLGFQRAFFDHYYPAPAANPLRPPADFAERAARFEGSYRIARGSFTTLEKITRLSATIQIRDAGNGVLLFDTPWGEWQYVEVEPLYFRQVNAPFGMVFREDEQGRITHMFNDFTPQFAFEKLSWYETPGFHMALLLVCVLVFLSMILIEVIRSIRNRLGVDRTPRVAPRIILGICVLNLLFVVGTVLWGNPVPMFGVSMIYKMVLGLGVLAAVLTVGALVYMVLAWKKGYWGVLSRVYYTLVTVAAVAFIWYLNYWNLLGWRF
jgi:hypothetical protein